MAAKKKAKLKITLIKSVIGSRPEQRGTVRSLGLRKLHHSVVQESSPAILGMIERISHMVQVEEVK